MGFNAVPIDVFQCVSINCICAADGNVIAVAYEDTAADVKRGRNSVINNVRFNYRIVGAVNADAVTTDGAQCNGADVVVYDIDAGAAVGSADCGAGGEVDEIVVDGAIGTSVIGDAVGNVLDAAVANGVVIAADYFNTSDAAIYDQTINNNVAAWIDAKARGVIGQGVNADLGSVAAAIVDTDSEVFNGVAGNAVGAGCVQQLEASAYAIAVYKVIGEADVRTTCTYCTGGRSAVEGIAADGCAI